MTQNTPAVIADRSVRVKETSQGNPYLALVQLAVENGTGMDQVEKLLALQERWEAGEAKKAYVDAMNRFKANPPQIFKTRKVEFGNTKYKHATLADASKIIGDELSKYGLSHRWETRQDDKGVIEVSCVITHVKGHEEKTTLKSAADNSGGKNSIQAIGSAVSYLQRYTLFAAAGLAADDQDDDGVTAGKPASAMTTPIPEAVLLDHIAAIDNSANFTELKQTYFTACGVATKANDKQALADFMKARDAKGNELVKAKKAGAS